MKLALLMLALVTAPDAGHEHCWHSPGWIHAVENHEDSVCCFCGESRCRSRLSLFEPLLHGPYAPREAQQIFFKPDGGMYFR